MLSLRDCARLYQMVNQYKLMFEAIRVAAAGTPGGAGHAVFVHAAVLCYSVSESEIAYVGPMPRSCAGWARKRAGIALAPYRQYPVGSMKQKDGKGLAPGQA
ncbi:hypothetical protein ACJJTC_006920 [Scirpophaga incertulas]